MTRWARENDFDPMVKAAVTSFDWPGLTQDQVFALIKAIIAKESSFRPEARPPSTQLDVSAGLMQVTPSTAKAMGYPGEIGDPGTLSGLYTPATNIYIGTKYLHSLVSQLGTDLEAVASAYNGGISLNRSKPYRGFGSRVTVAGRFCLARDSNGQCIRFYDAAVGQFGNQPYVDVVMHDYQYFLRSSPPVVAIGTELEHLTKASPKTGPSPVAEAARNPLTWGLVAAIGALALLMLRGR